MKEFVGEGVLQAMLPILPVGIMKNHTADENVVDLSFQRLRQSLGSREYRDDRGMPPDACTVLFVQGCDFHGDRRCAGLEYQRVDPGLVCTGRPLAAFPGVHPTIHSPREGLVFAHRHTGKHGWLDRDGWRTTRSSRCVRQPSVPPTVTAPAGLPLERGVSIAGPRRETGASWA